MIDPDALAVAQELDGLPLALATAGAYLEQVTTSFRDYLRLYKASWLKLHQTTPELSFYEDRQLYTTWQLSYDHIKQQNELSAKLLHLWAYFDNQDLWFELLKEEQSAGPEWFRQLTQDELSFNQAMRVLCNHGLAEAYGLSDTDDIESPGYSMHSCVHEWTIHVLNHERSTDMERLAFNCTSSHIPSNDIKGFWVTRRRLLQHASKCWLSIKEGRFEQDRRILCALNKLGVLYSSLEKLDKAEEILGWASRSCQTVVGEYDIGTFQIMNSMGDLFTQQGKLNEAEKMYERALHGFETTLGPDEIVTLNTCSRLGTLYSHQNKLNKAEEMYQRALQGYEKGPEPGHKTSITTTNELGIVYYNQGRLAEAEDTFLRALYSFEDAVGPNHPFTLGVVNNLGMLYSRQERFSLAEQMYTRALHGNEQTLGIDHTSILDTVNNLGALYANDGRYSEATEMLLRALHGTEKTLGPDHTSTLSIVHNLGGLYVKQERLDEAEAMFLRALHGHEKVLRLDHPCTLRTVHNLGIVYKRMGRKEEVQQLYARFPKAFTTLCRS